MEFSIQSITMEQARIMIQWQYDPPYDTYNFDADDLEEEARYLCNPENHYYAILDLANNLIGHCVFHAEGRVPGGDYSLDALDVGIGMRPDWTGKGQGTQIACAVFDFGQKQYPCEVLRSTVAAWNHRAQKVCTNNGFREVSRFFKTGTEREFVILVKELGS